MDKKSLKESLEQGWMHSWEEDTDTETVFRPASYKFPLSRRPRKSLTLKPDGTLIEGAGGPNDALQETEGTWKLEGDRLAFYKKSASKPGRVMKIVSLDKDRLVVRK